MAAGMCYQDAWRFLKREGEGTLIHGRVFAGYPQRWMDHAWVELPSGLIYEPTNEEYMDRKEFYDKFKAEVIDRYTLEEAAIQALRSGNFGPWVMDKERGMRYRSRL